MSPESPLSRGPPEPDPPVSPVLPLPPLSPGPGSGAGVVPVPPLPGLVVAPLPPGPPEPPELPVPGLLSFAGGESEVCAGGGVFVVFVVSAVASVAVPEAGVGSVRCGGRTGVSAFALARAFA